MFYGVISREALESNLKAHGTFSLTYRQYIDMVPTYVNMKAVKIRSEGNRVIIGISNVDAQVRRQEALNGTKSVVIYDLQNLCIVRRFHQYLYGGSKN